MRAAVARWLYLLASWLAPVTSKDWLQVYSGKKFYPLEPDRNEFVVADIARALSMLCRYNGHVARFYSVAEHACHVSDIVFARTKNPTLAFWALNHDDSEAFLCDVPRPMKRIPAMAPYRAAEKRVQEWVCDRLGLSREEPNIVREVDTEILGTEARALKSPIHPDWGKTTSTGQLPAAIEGLLLGWSTDRAEHEFLERFDVLQRMVETGRRFKPNRAPSESRGP